MKLSRYVVVSEPFHDETAGRTRRILYGTRKSAVRVLDERSWTDLAAGRFDGIPETYLADLVDAEVLVPGSEDELATILDQNAAAAEDDDQLYLVIQPTASCQLGCDYCGQEHTATRLTPDRQALLVARVQQRLAERRYRKLFVAWFGGEPLTALPVLRGLTPRFRDLAEQAGCGYGAKVVTNGLSLTAEVATELVRDHSVEHIEVTLDGAGPDHDARRHRKNGAPTFAAIYSNLVDLALRDDLTVDLSVRCNVDRRNADGVPRLLRTLAADGLQHRVSFYVASVYSWGNDAHLKSFTPDEFAEREIAWFADMHRLGFRISLIPPRKPVVCMATMPRAELVDAHGTLFTCTEVSYVPTYGTPNRYAIGSLADGELPDRRSVLGDFNERIARAEYPCAKCPMLPVCGGSCPKKWQEQLEPCPSAKRNIQDRLLLHYAITRLQADTAGTVPADTGAIA